MHLNVYGLYLDCMVAFDVNSSFYFFCKKWCFK